MSGPSHGKKKIKVNCYIHKKGKSLARTTHLDIEGIEISKIIKPGEITFIKGKPGEVFIALKKMIKRAEEFVEKEVKDEVVEEVIRSCEEHIKKYGHRKMSLKELDRLCGLK